MQGQALGDEPSAKTLQFLGGESVEAYSQWRAAGNNPPRTDPFFVPPDVAEIAQRQATAALVGAIRLAHFFGQLQDRVVPVSGFVGSPAHCWSHWFLFPPLPRSLGGHAIPDVYKVSLELLVERFAPVFQACLKYGTTFDLECHPSERAMGDIASAGDYLAAVDAAGFAKAAGFNFDCSHMEWQGVSGVDFIRQLRRPHPLRPHQGRAGHRRLHAQRPAGRPPADGRQAQRLELRHRRHRARRHQHRGS